MHNTEEINADSEKEKLLLPVFHLLRLYANLTRYFRSGLGRCFYFRSVHDAVLLSQTMSVLVRLFCESGRPKNCVVAAEITLMSPYALPFTNL